jgi:DNA ligase-1
MHFKDVAQNFQKIEQESSRIAITKLFAELMSHATAHEAQMITYLSLGLLRAPYEGSQFNFAEKNAVHVIADLLDMTERTAKEHAKKVGDLGTVVLEGTWKHEKDLTLTQVYQHLCHFADISGEGSHEQKSAYLGDLLRQVDQLSACYIIRMIIGKLRLGFSDMTVIDALSWSVAGNKSLRDALEHAYNISADIGLIAARLKEDGIEAIEKMKITVGIPIRPAAAERLPTAADIIKKLGPCVAQPKLDGFRLQVHIDKHTSDKPGIAHGATRGHTKLWFFSRNLLDMSAMFPDLSADVKHFDVTSLIVEGEALAYDEQTDSYLPFQETVKRRRKHDIEEKAAEMPLKLVLFDILYLDGKSLLDEPHYTREKILSKLVKSYNFKSVTMIPERHMETAHELNTYFLENITAGLEGLVVKRPDAIYQPGKRNFNWIKLKRHEEEGKLDDTLDCVILGYYAGKGKRASFGIGAFLVGVYDHEEDAFKTVAKIGTGLSDAEWRSLKKQCDGEALSHKPFNVVVDKTLEPDIWVVPSIVVMIRADEITRSPVHSAGRDKDGIGYALRFPRIMGYRPDKSAADATTVAELKSLFKIQKK